MDYVIKRSNGKIFATIPSNVILGPNVQSSTGSVPINLIGKNKISYGQSQNENFLWLAENFSGPTAPKGNVQGQIWYNAATTSGQLLMAVTDNAPQPDNNDPNTEAQWASIPVITVQNTLPEANSSLLGRMVFTNNADSLMVLAKNKEWREIQTSRPKNKQYETLLDINYDPGKTYIAFTQSASTKTLAFFNDGGGLGTDDTGMSTFVEGNGTLRFGSNYFYELKIIARAVLDNGVVIPTPGVYKTWRVTGSFYIDNAGNYTPGTSVAEAIPDPRKINTLTQIIDTYDQMGASSNWTIDVSANGIDTSIPGIGGITEAAYNAYINGSLNSKKHLGFKIQCSIAGLGAGQSVLLQVSAYMSLTGIPPVGV